MRLQCIINQRRRKVEKSGGSRFVINIFLYRNLNLTAKGVWERYKLAQRSPIRQRFWCILDQKRNFWWDLNLPQWRSQEIGGKFIFPLISILSNSV